MPLPTINDVVLVDPVLTDVSIGFRNEAFMGEKIAPFQESPTKTGTIIIYDRGDALRLPGGATRAPSGPYRRVGFGVGSGTFNCRERGFEFALDDPTLAASQTPESLETYGLQHLTHLMELELETAIAAAAFVTGVWGTSATLTAAQKWSNYETSNPMTRSKTAIRTIKQNTATTPNTLFVGALTWDDLKDHPLIVQKYSNTQPGLMTPELVAAAMGVAELVVGDAVQNTAAQGATFVGADIWTDSALWLVRNAPALAVANGAYTHVWNETGGNFPWGIQNYREEGIRGGVQRIFTHYDVQIHSTEHGYLALDTN